MAMSLSVLGPQLVAHILSFNDSSFLSRILWMTGNLTLQHVLECGITYIELRNPREPVPLKLPKYLTHMRSLRHLIIDRAHSFKMHRIHDRRRTLEVVSGLPKALESIAFRFLGSSDIFFPEDSSSTAFVSIKASFPTLRCLILDSAPVWTPAMVSELPLSLTDLYIRLPPQTWERVRELMSLLPASLARLAIRCESFEQLTPARLFPLLPSTLLHFRLEFGDPAEEDEFLGRFSMFNVASLALLPRSLASIIYRHGTLGELAMGHNILDIDHQVTDIPFFADLSGNCTNVVPPFIETMYLRGLDMKKPSNTLVHLPPHLTNLAMHRISSLKVKTLLLLPPHVTCFSCEELSTKGVKPKHWPPSLKKLEFHTLDKVLRASNAALLPPLTSLNVRGPANWDAVSHLPRTLIWLKLTVPGNVPQSVAWPPNLRSLIFYGSAIDTTTFGVGLDPNTAKKLPVSKVQDMLTVNPLEHCVLSTLRLSLLPRSLTNLTLGGYFLPASELLWLPPFLTTLRFTQLEIDSRWKPFEHATLSRARELLQLAREDEDYNFLALGGSEPQVTLFDLLPRSLTFLSYVGPSDLPPIAWSRLPRKLRTFISQSGSNPADALLYFPKTLRFIDFQAHNLGDEHMKALPHQLQGQIRAPGNHLTASAAASVPWLLQLLGIDTQTPFYIALKERCDALKVAASSYEALKIICDRDDLFLD